jgi:dUTP pyrophosphatase
MILTGKAIVENQIVTDMVDADNQEQMCGIDLTVKKIERYLGIGVLDFDNKKRKLPKLAEIKPERSVALPGDDSIEGYRLEAGCYLVSFNETVSVPEDCCGIARPRSSLLRCGATIETSVWDPGYKGKSQSMLVVHNPVGIILGKDAKLMQIVFMRMETAASKTYSGVYQGEGIVNGSEMFFNK